MRPYNQETGMKFETSFGWDTVFQFNYSQPFPFFVAMLLVIVAVLIVLRIALWVHEWRIMRKMTRESLDERRSKRRSLKTRQ